MEKHLVIFNNKSRASIYGIGTYISQLRECLIEHLITFDIIFFDPDQKEIEIKVLNGYREVVIPAYRYLDKGKTDKHARDMLFILKNHILNNSEAGYVFHLNYMGELSLIKNIKKIFKSKVILTCHYTEWSFKLHGNIDKFNSLVSSPKRKIRDTSDRMTHETIYNDIKSINACDYFICVANHTYSSFSKTNMIKNNNINIIHNSLRDIYTEITVEQKRKLREKIRIPHDSKIVLYAGRLDSVKGVEYLIDAFKTVIEHNDNTYLLVAGDGDYSNLMNKARSCFNRIVFTGLLSKDDLYELYQASDIGVVSSLHEEFGYVAIEMMMHKLPIIVGDTGGLSDIVEHGVSGLKVDISTRVNKRVLNVSKLANFINLLLSDPELSNKLANKGRERFLEKFESGLFSDKMISLYNQV